MTLPAGYFNRFDEDKHYEQHLFVAGVGLQSAELNEIQEYPLSRIKGVADALFSDGDIVRDGSCRVNPATGEVDMHSGSIYANGAVRNVDARSFSIPVVGVVFIGLYLIESEVSALEDPTLRDPASGTRNYQETGAWRKKIVPRWGYSSDGTDGEFYPIYEVVDGILKQKTPPPEIDAFSDAIARYDRDNSGGMYVVNGYAVSKADDVNGQQSYSVSAGRARINGYAVERQTDSRVYKTAAPTLRMISAEPHLSSSTAATWFPLDRSPVAEVVEVQKMEQKTVTLTRGMIAGGADTLPDSSVLELVSVVQGASGFAVGTNVRLYQGRVDWSLSGAEPAGGSTYDVTYKYIKTYSPEASDVDLSGNRVQVDNAVTGSLVLITYTCMLPQIDRLCINQSGEFIWVDGVPDDYSPVAPNVPGGLFLLATVHQTWSSSRRVVNDSVRMVSMSELASVDEKFDRLTDFVNRLALSSNANAREVGIKKGLLVDSFMDDQSRDLGLGQTAVCVDGSLGLPVSASAEILDLSANQPMTLIATEHRAVLTQSARTGAMKINPYQSFPVRPATVTLVPSRDFWTDTVISTLPDLNVAVQKATETKRITNYIPYGQPPQAPVVTTAVVSINTQSHIESIGMTRTGTAQFLRQKEVQFMISGFGPGERLSLLTFDGVPVTPVAP